MLDRGKRQFESMLYLLIVLIVSVAFYFWVEKLALATERSKIDYDLSNIRGAIHMFELSKIMTSSQAELVGFSGENPMHILEMIRAPLPNYYGVLRDNDTAPIGSWYFNSNDRYLGYKVSSNGLVATMGEILQYELKYFPQSTKKASVGRLKLLQKIE